MSFFSDLFGPPPVRADTVLAGGNLRRTPRETLVRDIRRFSLAAEQATDPKKRERHLANLERSKALLAALDLEAR